MKSTIRGTKEQHYLPCPCFFFENHLYRSRSYAPERELIPYSLQRCETQSVSDGVTYVYFTKQLFSA